MLASVLGNPQARLPDVAAMLMIHACPVIPVTDL